MTQEEKDLLLKDLCARLPYGVKGIITYNGDKDIFTIKGIFNILFLSDTECCRVEDFKPYLRPMSSMTEEEKREFQSFFPGSFGNQFLDVKEGYIDIHECESTTRLYLYDIARLIEWLNKNMFDFRGLIPEGLALSTDVFSPYKD